MKVTFCCLTNLSVFGGDKLCCDKVFQGTHEQLENSFYLVTITTGGYQDLTILKWHEK